MIIKNKKARFEYEFIDKYVAGIMLTGTEIKSVRNGKVSLKESYCYISKNEIFVKKMHIAPYQYGTIYNHEPERTRKLLLNKKEILKLKKAIAEKGLTVIVDSMFISGRGLAKLNIALARGKKIHDKRNALKAKDQKKEIKRLQGL